MKRATLEAAENARTAMELFDLAAEMMQRVRGDATTRRTADAIARRCVRARNRLLPPLDRARAECHRKECGNG